MTKGQYPTIQHGMGNLTPELWRRLMNMLRKFEAPIRDETSFQSEGVKAYESFPAVLAKAKCIDPNRYIYSWSAVEIQDDNSVIATTPTRTSTGENDEWDFAAINLMEVANTETRASAGVDMSADTYPSGFTMQAIGGGSCDTTDCEVVLAVSPVVMLTKLTGRTTETVARYVFSNTNEHDGACNSDFVVLTDGVTAPTPVPADNLAYVYVDESDGDLYYMDKDGNSVKIGDV